MKSYVGIDPGATGAMAVIFGDGRVEIFDDPRAIKDILSPDWQIFAAIEWAQPMPKQGVVSVFTYGKGYGRLLQLLEDFGIAYQEIRPTMWKKEFSLIHQDKEKSIELAKKLFPSISDKLTRKKDHGRAEALLIAEYARRKNM